MPDPTPPKLEAVLVRIIDEKTGASMAAVSGVTLTRTNDNTFTFRSEQLESMAGHPFPGQYIEVTTRNAKGRAERWRSDAMKIEGDTVILTVQKVGA